MTDFDPGSNALPPQRWGRPIAARHLSPWFFATDVNGHIVYYPFSLLARGVVVDLARATKLSGPARTLWWPLLWPLDAALHIFLSPDQEVPVLRLLVISALLPAGMALLWGVLARKPFAARPVPPRPDIGGAYPKPLLLLLSWTCLFGLLSTLGSSAVKYAAPGAAVAGAVAWLAADVVARVGAFARADDADPRAMTDLRLTLRDVVGARLERSTRGRLVANTVFYAVLVLPPLGFAVYVGMLTGPAPWLAKGPPWLIFAAVPAPALPLTVPVFLGRVAFLRWWRPTAPTAPTAGYAGQHHGVSALSAPRLGSQPQVTTRAVAALICLQIAAFTGLLALGVAAASRVEWRSPLRPTSQRAP